ncbi:MAG: hypothetical protein HUK16_05915, partial [Bacteroidales bacterium]|nr:hypothetical protein [Bacteroidales bacterium]
EAKGIIDEIQIASDCLDTDIISRAEQLLRGASTHRAPEHAPNEIVDDIVKLVYG